MSDTAQVIEVSLWDYMLQNFMRYAKDVILSRSLPNAADGLKPVHRRILYSMMLLGLHSSGTFKKSARTVGDVLGRTHPHGDQSVYDAMVGLAQDFSMRYPLVSGHGNFGSMDGDPPAAMRYTESKLSKYGELLLTDINKNTVDFQPNYDESEEEPATLPGLFPQLLLNGTSGIAVGMACSFAPHCASDIYKALDVMIDRYANEDPITDEEIIKIVKAPDFPTGGVIMNISDVHKIYAGEKRGSVIIRCKYEVENVGKRQQIVVSEIPYTVNKATMVSQINNLREKVEDIVSATDESDKDGIRVVIKLKSGANTEMVLRHLWKETSMQSSYSMNHTAIVDGKAKDMLSLKDMLECFLFHACDVVKRRTEFDLEKDRTRKNIVSGILLVLGNIDKAIKIIRESATDKDAVDGLRESFGMSEEQAAAILEIKLGRLTHANVDEYKNELEKLKERIEEYETVLSSESFLLRQVQKDLRAVSKKYFKDDKRKTEISTEGLDESSELDLVKEEDVVALMMTNGTLKLVLQSEYQARNRNTKTLKNQGVKDETIQTMLQLTTKENLLFFTSLGNCYTLPAYKLPIVSKTGAGKYIRNYISMEENEEIIAMLSTSAKENNKSIIMVTEGGVIKRITKDIMSTRFSKTHVINLNENDRITSVTLAEDGDYILIFTKNGKVTRYDPFNGKTAIRAMGRTAAGVRGISLSDDDSVGAAFSAKENEKYLIMTQNGYAKRGNVIDIPTKRRISSGVKAITCTSRTGTVISACKVDDTNTLFVATKNGNISHIKLNTIRTMSRNASGVKSVNLDSDDSVSLIAVNQADTDDEEKE